MGTYQIDVNYASPEEVMLEVDDIPILIRANDDGIKFVQIGEEVIDIGEYI